MRGQIRAVSFDVGGTLIEPWPSVGHAYASVAGRFGVNCDPEAITQRFFEGWKTRRDFRYTKSEWFGVVQQCFPVEIREEVFDAIYDHFCEPTPWRLFEDANESIEYARARGLKMAVVSNWDERLRPLLAGLKLAAHFDAIIISGELGFHKPEREIFDAAARELRVPAESIAHFGDSEREDVEGARAAGMTGVKIERKGGKELLEALREVLG